MITSRLAGEPPELTGAVPGVVGRKRRLPGKDGRAEQREEMMRKTYPEWIWRSYDARPAWAAEATIEEWASHARFGEREPVTRNAHRDRLGGPDWRGEGAPSTRVDDSDD